MSTFKYFFLPYPLFRMITLLILPPTMFPCPLSFIIFYLLLLNLLSCFKSRISSRLCRLMYHWSNLFNETNNPFDHRVRRKAKNLAYFSFLCILLYLYQHFSPFSLPPCSFLFALALYSFLFLFLSLFSVQYKKP